ncbi:oligopeptide/dipeptide ABC transporter ATP-binding protein [Candidatus Poriferisodalis sp.]|uniref:oligopeptide/dipeptide ABC transporter ATP-binding protein n=1 Tax=Candidatus Poriferisodalis sp. TaxID=3101277 RepID=UPI003B5C2BCA
MTAELTSLILEAADVTVRFRASGRGRATLALDGVGITVERGRTTGLVGESGAGKSTLGRVVLGLVPIASGSVRIGGADISKLTAARRRELRAHLQAVYQDPLSSLNPSYSVFWSLAEPLRARQVGNRSEIAARVASTLEAVGMEPEAAHRRPAALSGGQLQRICVARAIITLPELVILDEAVSALDLSVQAQILNLLRDLQDERNLSYLFISHDMAVVRHFCHDVTVLYRGQIMESGPTGEVTDAPAHPYTRALMQASPVADPVAQRRRRLAAVAESAQSPTTASDGCIYAPRCPFTAPECHQRRPELREIAPGRFVACDRYPEWTDARTRATIETN